MNKIRKLDVNISREEHILNLTAKKNYYSQPERGAFQLHANVEITFVADQLANGQNSINNLSFLRIQQALFTKNLL